MFSFSFLWKCFLLFFFCFTCSVKRMLSGLLSRSSEALQWVDGRHSSWSLKVNDFHLTEYDPESTTSKPAATFCGHTRNLEKIFGRFKVRFHREISSENQSGSGVCPKKHLCHLVTAVWQWLWTHTKWMLLLYEPMQLCVSLKEQPCLQYFSSEKGSDMNHFPWEKKKNLLSISYTWVKLSLLVIHTRLIYYIALKRKCSKCIQHIKYLCLAKSDWRALYNWYECIKPRMNC